MHMPTGNEKKKRQGRWLIGVNFLRDPVMELETASSFSINSNTIWKVPKSPKGGTIAA